MNLIGLTMKKIFCLLGFLTVLFIGCKQENNEIETKELSKDKGTKIKSIHQEEWEKYRNKLDSNFDSLLFNLEIVDVKIIVDSSIGKFWQPKFTSDGNKIIFTTENYNGLWIYDIQNNILEQLNNIPQSGYNYIYSESDNSIYFLNKISRGKKRGQAYSIIKSNIDSKSMDVIFTSEERLSMPQFVNNQILFLEGNNLKNYDISAKKIIDEIKGTYIIVQNDMLIKYESTNDSVKIILKYPKIVSILEYDMQYIFCLTASEGIIICDYDGVIFNKFRNARTISRLDNSNIVIFAVEQDDGKEITSSEFYIGFINSNEIKELNFDKKNLKFNPDWSPKENKIVYNDNKGNIKILELKIK